MADRIIKVTSCKECDHEHMGYCYYSVANRTDVMGHVVKETKPDNCPLEVA